VRVQGFKDYLVGSLQDLAERLEQLELSRFETPEKSPRSGNLPCGTEREENPRPSRGSQGRDDCEESPRPSRTSNQGRIIGKNPVVLTVPVMNRNRWTSTPRQGFSEQNQRIQSSFRPLSQSS
jgi:hypothetical protein